MPFDLFQSRRNYNEPCKWWSRKENSDVSEDTLIMQRIPTGTFMAREISPEQLQDLIIGGTFMFDKATTVIKSSDNLSNLKNKDLVWYQGEKWIVQSVQKSKARIQNTQFAYDKNCSHFWYIELRK